MALLDSEIRRIRYELGYNVLSAGADAYIGVSAVFEQVIQTYMTAGATTTSATTVAVSSAPTPRTITLTSATGFAQFDPVVVDVDSRQERAIVQSVTGSTITLLLLKAHTGTYPVTVEGGESIVRDIVRQLVDLSSKIDGAASQAGIKKVDEVEFFEGGARFLGLAEHREYLRDELASALGVVNLRTQRNARASVVELY
jgi:hypothetical protein